MAAMDTEQARLDRKREVKRAAKRRRVEAIKMGPYREAVSGWMDAVDATPVIEFMERYLKQPTATDNGKRGWEEIGRKTGITARSLWRIRQTKRAHIATLDTILIRLDGPPLSWFYPLED